TGGAADSTNRVVFVARSNGNIDVFDTFFYNSIGTIPVRDPIIGPLRVAKDPGGNQLLFGITAKGLVMVNLPILPNPNPAPPRRLRPRRPHEDRSRSDRMARRRARRRDARLPDRDARVEPRLGALAGRHGARGRHPRGGRRAGRAGGASAPGHEAAPGPRRPGRVPEVRPAR